MWLNVFLTLKNNILYTTQYKFECQAKYKNDWFSQIIGFLKEWQSLTALLILVTEF